MKKGTFEVAAVDEKEHFAAVWIDGDSEKAEKLENAYYSRFRQVYAAIDSGDLDAARISYAGQKNTYILHRSTRPGVRLQLSVAMVTESGDLVPMSHRDLTACDQLLPELSLYQAARVDWLRIR